MEITLDGSRFEYRTCYQEESGLRGSFNDLAKTVFGLDFEAWHRAGNWTAPTPWCGRGRWWPMCR